MGFNSGGRRRWSLTLTLNVWAVGDLTTRRLSARTARRTRSSMLSLGRRRRHRRRRRRRRRMHRRRRHRRRGSSRRRRRSRRSSSSSHGGVATSRLSTRARALAREGTRGSRLPGASRRGSAGVAAGAAAARRPAHSMILFSQSTIASRRRRSSTTSVVSTESIFLHSGPLGLMQTSTACLWESGDMWRGIVWDTEVHTVCGLATGGS